MDNRLFNLFVLLLLYKIKRSPSRKQKKVSKMILLLLLRLKISKNSKNQSEKNYYPAVVLTLLSARQFKEHFRFKREDISLLQIYLQIPEIINLGNRIKVPGSLALLILLKRLSYPNRLSDLSIFFGKSKSYLSQVINYLCVHIDTSFGHLLQLHSGKLLLKILNIMPNGFRTRASLFHNVAALLTEPSSKFAGHLSCKKTYIPAMNEIMG